MYIKTIEFNARYIPEILAGKKTATVRPVGNEHFEGNELAVLMEAQTGKPFAIGRILSVDRKAFAAFTEEEKNSCAFPETFASFADQFRKNYGVEITPETTIAFTRFIIVDDGQKREKNSEDETSEDENEE